MLKALFPRLGHVGTVERPLVPLLAGLDRVVDGGFREFFPKLANIVLRMDHSFWREGNPRNSPFPRYRIDVFGDCDHSGLGFELDCPLIGDGVGDLGAGFEDAGRYCSTAFRSARRARVFVSRSRRSAAMPMTDGEKVEPG